MPVCLLPIPPNTRILERWIRLIERVGSVRDIYVVTGRPEDVDQIQAVVDDFRSACGSRIRVTRDLREHRGTAGTVRDTIAHYVITDDVIVVEGTTIPPGVRIDIHRQAGDDESMAGVLASDANSEPAGIILLRNDVFRLVPEIGFFDLKEQLVPKILDGGRKIRVCKVDDVVRRITSVHSYNRHIKSMAEDESGSDERGPWIHETARVDPSAIIDSSVVVGKDVRIGPGAVVIDSVILEGARIRGESVVARSTIKANTEVKPGSRIVESVNVLEDARVPLHRQRRFGNPGEDAPRFVGVRK